MTISIPAGSYDPGQLLAKPRTDQWPSPPGGHTASWTDSEMIVWGGERCNTFLTRRQTGQPPLLHQRSQQERRVARRESLPHRELNQVQGRDLLRHRI